ncbi:hypothetical protein C0991_010467, partial [Blastosporella zonata]
MEVPDFTPLGRRPAPPARPLSLSSSSSRALGRVRLPEPMGPGAPFSDLYPEQDGDEGAGEGKRKRKLPASLLAPRYSHLLEEAVAVSQSGSVGVGVDMGCAERGVDREEEEERQVEEEMDRVEGDGDGDGDGESEGAYDPGNDREEDEEDNTSPPIASPPSHPHHPQAPPSTLKTRVKTLLFSYLPSATRSRLAPHPLRLTTLPKKPVLPPPPPSKSRGPITTPVRPAPPQPQVPKDLVHLHPAPVSIPTKIPRAQKPKRLVELNRVSPPPEPEKKIVAPRGRRSSGGSVKDLVRGFEEMKKNEEEEGRRRELKR